MSSVTLTEEQLADIVADAAKKGAEKALKEPIRKFNPGAGLEGERGGHTLKGKWSEGKVLDAADQPWGPIAKDAAGREVPTGAGIFFQAVMRAATTHDRDIDPRLLRSKAATGADESIPGEGGFLVAQEFIPKILERAYSTGVVAKLCGERIQVGPNYNGTKIPAVDETSRANGSRWGGVQAYWAAEASSITKSKAGLRQIAMELQKLVALVYCTDELLQDSVQLEGYINKWFGLEMGFKLDDAIINGDGVGKPQGILSAACLVSQTAETGQAAATIVAKNIAKMWRRFWAPSRANGVWLINQDTEGELMTLNIPIGTAGALFPLYIMPGMPGNTAIPGGENFGLSSARMMNRPVYVIEQAATLGTVGDVILADFSQYQLIEKSAMQAAVSIHVQFLTDETAFRFVYRINGQPIWNAALTPFKGSNTLSPFVALATRS